jgi:diaminohydroxyphosphoribosylaminopyrimidine deaminase/5-amino-6-(5-phosphoribosylamino)uracil reductase
MRHASDAVLTGIGTVLADDPMLTDRTDLPRRRRLLRVVMDTHLRIDRRSRLVRGAQEDVLVFTCARENAERAVALRQLGVEVVRVRQRFGRPDLRAVLAELGGRNIMSVLLESGSTLNQAALNADVVDKVRMFYAPRLAGTPAAVRHGAAFPAPTAAATAGARRVRDISRVRMEQFGPDFALEGYLRDVYGNR